MKRELFSNNSLSYYSQRAFFPFLLNVENGMCIVCVVYRILVRWMGVYKIMVS